MSYQGPHRLHMTSDGERWDMLAFRYYGTVSEQARIIKANRHLFDVEETLPTILPAGLTLIVPVIEKAKTSRELLPPWMQ